MDFFDQQETAKKQTRIMLGYFSVAIVGTILLVYLFPLMILFALRSAGYLSKEFPLQWWNPALFLAICGGTVLVVMGGALFKIYELRRNGGEGVALMLGGHEVYPDTADFFEKRLRNIVEEMSIASGVPVPAIYVLRREKGINAFAAGFSTSDAVVAVTYGAMTGLTRDELQGVIAHEFSHILNNDMATNIHMMGFLYGLLLIGLTGQIVLNSMGRSRGRGSAPILFGGLCLLIVGYFGVLCTKLIKASVSRSRERLADASAVQFTRNPQGLASALKKIGGLSFGSLLSSSQAEQASHMFFGKGVRGASLFSTHPSLDERVRWLDPLFDGTFPHVTMEDLHRQLAKFEGAPIEKTKPKKDLVDLFTHPENLMVATAVLGSATAPKYRPNNPEALIDSIGRPMQEHAEAARQLLESIPEKAKEYARDPHGARMLIYFLLLSPEESVREKQMAFVREQAEPEVFEVLEEAIPHLSKIKPEMRLPIVDLAIPALRFLSLAQYASFRKLAKDLIYADEQVDLFEYALQRVLVRHLDPTFKGKPRRHAVNYYSIAGLQEETSVVLSVLARKGHDDPEMAASAFIAATQKISVPNTKFQFLEEEVCSWEHLDAALNPFSESSAKVKKWLLGAALACLMHDRKITLPEVELFRAIADSLDCPVPPWIVPSEMQA